MYRLLEREGREASEKPDEVIARMALKDGDVVADVGTGIGYFARRLARRVGPSGKVLAVDIQQAMLDILAERTHAEGITNIELILGEPDDPKLPEGRVDWVLLVDAYHEFSDPVGMLEKIKAAMKPGTGRVALLEYRGESALDNFRMIPRDHKMTFEEVMIEWQDAGFELDVLYGFLPLQHFFVFKVKDEFAWHESARIEADPAVRARNATRFGNYVYFAAQPEESDFKLYADRGVKTVINLRTPEEMASLGFDEKAAVEAAGMAYVQVPIGADGLDRAGLQEIALRLENAGSAPALLHCASSNRVGYVWSIFRATRHGLDEEAAVAEGKQAGLRAPALETSAREWIRQMSP